MAIERILTVRRYTHYSQAVDAACGATVEVFESSLLTGCCSLLIDANDYSPEATAHFDRPGVVAVMERLQAWLDDHPEVS
jgi:hypothetical protein